MIDYLKLSHQQELALSAILTWYEKTDKQYFVLSGYAGTGKTTIARQIGHMFPMAAFCAYTGKAAHVLREKGVPNSQTIHSLLYKLQGKDDKGQPIFSLRKDGQELVIIDEYSMLDKAFIQDILSRCKRVLFLGDPAQLPPIKDGKISLLPDFILTEIHRQALDNPVLKWAHRIRDGHIPREIIDDGCFQTISKSDVTTDLIATIDQVIVGKNITRNLINEHMRDYYEFSSLGNIPVKGDKMICLKNNHKEGLYNGMIFGAESAAQKWDKMQSFYSLYVDGTDRNVWDGDVLKKDTSKYNYHTGLERFDYAYAITCHKAQGSEFDSVLIYDEGWGAERIKWLYTAVTRAKTKCILAI